MLLPLGQLAAEEEQVGAVFLLGGQRLGLVERVLGILPAAQADVHLADGEPNTALFVGRGAVKQALRHGQTFVGIALVGQFAGQHQLQIAILGIGGHRLAGDLDGLVEFVGVAVRVHLALVAARGKLPPISIIFW